MTYTVLDFAMEYSRLGLAVLPLHYPVRHQHGMACSCGRTNCNSPAKHPVGHLVPNGLKNATTDHEVVERWFRDQPWNIAIVTGKTSGIIALDVDPRHGGDKFIAALENKHGPLPQTWRFLTGGGGEHVLFRHPGGLVPNNAGKLGVGIDVRGEVGYIVAPPSRHMSGRNYSISVDHHPDDIPLADPPPWLIALVKADAAVECQRRNGEGSYRLCNSRRTAERYLGPDFRSPARPPDRPACLSRHYPFAQCHALPSAPARKRICTSLPVSRIANLPREQPVVRSSNRG